MNEEYRISIGKHEGIVWDEETEKIMVESINKLNNGEKLEINDLDYFDCKLLLFLLKDREFDSAYERFILDLALKSIECDEITAQGREYVPGINMTNSLLLDNGIQIQIEKKKSGNIYIKYYQDDLGLFSRIRELIEEIEEYEK